MPTVVRNGFGESVAISLLVGLFFIIVTLKTEEDPIGVSSPFDWLPLPAHRTRPIAVTVSGVFTVFQRAAVVWFR